MDNRGRIEEQGAGIRYPIVSLEDVVNPHHQLTPDGSLLTCKRAITEVVLRTRYP